MAREAPAIEEYLLIGDLHTAALVSNRGAIDWLCLPHFDSPSLFGALLDQERGGTFAVQADDYSAQAAYVPETAIVETRFTKRDHVFLLRDYMVPQASRKKTVTHYLVRTLEGMTGHDTVRFTFEPQANYGKQCLQLHVEEGLISATIGEYMLWLHIPKEATITRRSSCGVEIDIPLAAGETRFLAMEYSLSERSRFSRQRKGVERRVREFWKEWVAQGEFFEFSRERLIRSAITLKLMQFYPTGAIIAAPTTSLPEEIGGVRNWDYRYVWIRDATFSLYALYELGYREEAKRFFRYIERIVEEAKDQEEEGGEIDVSLLYTIHGQPPPREEDIDHLRGYRGSAPVRLGNGAAEQFQLDTYGALIDAYYFMTHLGVRISAQGREVICHLVEKIAKHWRDPDNGIWEVRTDLKQFTYSRVMAWVGVNRAIRLAKRLKISAAKRREWEALEQEIADWIWEQCYDEERQIFRQYPGAKAQDATNFLFVALQFLDRHEERTKQIIATTRRELCHNEHFVYRYKNPDGLPGEEGAFVLCSHWLIAALAAVGELDEAERLFHRLELCLNANGLYAEEVDPQTCHALGNYPQAFSHIGYIFSAYYIHKYWEKFR